MDLGSSALKLVGGGFSDLFPDPDSLSVELKSGTVRSELLAGRGLSIQRPLGERYYEADQRFSFGHNSKSTGMHWESQQQRGHVELVEALSAEVQLHDGQMMFGSSRISTRLPMLRSNQKNQLSVLESNLRQRSGKQDLLGIAPVQWFGSAFVEAFGGDSVFEGLPGGWAERVRPGLWKVFGVEDPEDPDAFQVEVWSDRERALIEALGPEFFFNVETGELATEFVEIPIASQYPVYLWDEAAGGLVIHEPDGSTRPANLDDPNAVSSSSDDAVERPRRLSHLVVERMTEVMGDVFVDDDQLYWVEQHLQIVPDLDDVWVEAFSVWLGEHVIKGIFGAEWVEQGDRWVVSSSRGLFDPEPVVRATVGSEARGEQRVMVSAACEAMGLPLP